MESNLKSQEENKNIIPKSKRYRKDKPWDNDPNLDKWKIEEFQQGDMKDALAEISSFSVLYPQYREKYISEFFPLIKKSLKEVGIKAELDKLEGSITVFTTKKTWDPYIIIKARDMIKLISRSVPYEKAKSILSDGIDCDVIKIRHFVNNKERFIKRRQRLIGPKGMTLKALELLTFCYILVQGSTVSVIGNFKQIKIVRRIIVDCMNNIHPVYHIKELMIKEKLAKDPEMKNENWDRFLPQFKKRNIKRKKPKYTKKKENDYNPFPPEQMPRKIDIELETGEYWEKKNSNNRKSQTNNKEKSQIVNSTALDSTSISKKEKRLASFIPPDETNFIIQKNKYSEPSLDELKGKFLGNKRNR